MSNEFSAGKLFLPSAFVANQQSLYGLQHLFLRTWPPLPQISSFFFLPLSGWQRAFIGHDIYFTAAAAVGPGFGSNFRPRQYTPRQWSTNIQSNLDNLHAFNVYIATRTRARAQDSEQKTKEIGCHDMAVVACR